MSQCLLFDCDGTLVDSERLCSIALARRFQPLGVSLDVDELETRFRGWKFDTILDVIAKEHSIILPEDFVASYRAIVSQLFETELKPIEGIKNALMELPQVKAVVSSGPTHKIRQALRVCGLSEFFGENTYSAYDVGIWKPDPGIYLYAAQDMGYASKDCCVIEDSLVGVEAGYDAGMKTFFYNPLSNSCDLPNVISFSSMFSLPELINS